MRIGIVTGEYYPMRGGVGDFSRELAFGLCRRGHEVHLIIPVNCSHAPHAPSPASCILHPVILHWSYSSLLRIRALARKLNLNLINLQYQTLAYGMTLPIHFLPRLAGLPVVVTFHDLRVPYLFPYAGPLRRAVVNALAGSAAGVIVTNPEDEQALASRVTCHVSRLARIPIGSNFQVNPPPGYDREQWREAMGLGPGEILVGFFGFLNRAKGGQVLIDTMEILVARGLPVRLVLVGGTAPPSPVRDPSVGGGAGGEGQYHQVLENLDPQARLGDRVIVTGYLEPPLVSAHLLACDVLALPYSSGATLRSGSFIAALLHGCPIVITEPLVPIPELEDGKNVCLVPREDPRATADAIQELLTAANLLAQLSSGAQSLAREFEWDEIAVQTAALFERIRTSP